MDSALLCDHLCDSLLPALRRSVWTFPWEVFRMVGGAGAAGNGTPLAASVRLPAGASFEFSLPCLRKLPVLLPPVSRQGRPLRRAGSCGAVRHGCCREEPLRGFLNRDDGWDREIGFAAGDDPFAFSASSMLFLLISALVLMHCAVSAAVLIFFLWGQSFSPQGRVLLFFRTSSRREYRSRTGEPLHPPVRRPGSAGRDRCPGGYSRQCAFSLHLMRDIYFKGQQVEG